jgi:hypothetical protein
LIERLAMESATYRSRNFAGIKNALVCLGVYFACGWFAFFFAVVYDKLTQHMMYSGFFETVVILPLVEHFPRALFAVVAGIVVVYFVESDRVLVWVLFLSALYAALGLLGYHWSRPPMFSDRLAQMVGSFFPAVGCLLGGFVATRGSTVSQVR